MKIWAQSIFCKTWLLDNPVKLQNGTHCTKKWSFPLRIWSHLLKKSLIENFMFCVVIVSIGFSNNWDTLNCPVVWFSSHIHGILICIWFTKMIFCPPLRYYSVKLQASFQFEIALVMASMVNWQGFDNDAVVYFNDSAELSC